MATASVTNTFVAGTAAQAAQVNTNFTNLVTFLNNSVVHRDGSKAMTASFDAGTNKIINVSDGTDAADAVNKGQLDAVAAVGAVTSWTAQSLGTGWSTYSGSYTAPAYRKVGDMVQLRGHVKTSGAIGTNDIICTLAASHRPPAAIILPVYVKAAGAGAGQFVLNVVVATTGTVTLDYAYDATTITSASTITYLSLEGLTFSVTA